MKKTLVVLISLLLACCSNVKSEEKKEVQASPSVNTVSNPSITPTSILNIQKQDPEMNQEGFKPKFIAAADLLKKINSKEKIYIFDVRNKESYDEAHIKTSQNKPIPITADLVKDIPKDAQIVTYCGCPHHLSSIGAEQLTNLGYKNVHVLNEGFFYWKDHNYPLEVAKGSKSTLSEIDVEGKLTKADQPLANTDIYLKHLPSGALEATRTDASGGYKMHFHVYNYKNNDKFKFFVGDLKTPVRDFSTDKPVTKDVLVKMP